MRTWISLLLLCLAGSGTLAQAATSPGALTDATVTDRTAMDNPAAAVRKISSGWLALSMPATAGTHSPCCWKGRWNSGLEVGCSLDSDRHSYGTRSDSPLTDHVIAYARIQDGEVHSLRVVGESCPVDGAGAEVNWLGLRETRATLDWLQSVARSSRQGSDDAALYAMALHASPIATDYLRAIAQATEDEHSEEAIFWLGEARGADGFRELNELLEALPPGEKRREINFALAQNDSDAAIDRLVEISQSDTDPEQRSNALFWLAQERPDRAEGLIRQVLEKETDEEVLEEAIFAASQLPGKQGTQLLLELAQNPEMSRVIRRQAMFWLANSDDEEAVVALEKLLVR